MKETVKKYKDLLDSVIEKAVVMNASTEMDAKLDDNFKVIQRATSLCILEPIFDYMSENGNDAMKDIVSKYKKHLDILKANGVIESIDDIQTHIDNLQKKMETKEADEKNNDNNG